MSHPVCYTVRMKMIMKEQTNKANNLILGAVYINANTGAPCRLVNIVACQGVWLEAYDGQGYGDLVKFDDVHYADKDEVQDYLDDYRVYNDVTSNKVNNGIESTLDDRENYDTLWSVQGYYNDDEGNDIRCRD